MKRTLITLIACFCGYWACAELPQSLDDVLFGLCGGTNYEDYVKWLSTDGTMKFDRTFVIFDKAQFRMHYPTNDFAPRHYSIEMEREFSDESSSTNLVDFIQKAESILLQSFGGKKFKRLYDGVNYQSSCTNIDGRGWDAFFSVAPLRNNGKTSYVAKARFFNPLHREGRFVSCEDFADASKFSPTLHETLSSPVDRGGWNIQMIGSGACTLEKPFFLFDTVRFKSTEPTATDPGEVYEIEMEYKKHRAAGMNIAVSAIKDAETYLSENFIPSTFESKKSPGHYTSSCDSVDRCGWHAEFSVHQDTKSDTYIAHALFRRKVNSDAHVENGLKDQRTESHAEGVRDQLSARKRDDLYVAVTTNSFNQLALTLGVRPYPVDLHALNDELRHDLSSKCILMLMHPSEYDKTIEDALVRSLGIQVAFVSPNELDSYKIDELKALVARMTKSHDDRISKEKQIASANIDDLMARHRKSMETELFGPYHVDNLTLPEVVEYLFLRVNGDLKPYSDFSLGMGVSMDGGKRYSFQIPRAHVAEIFSYAAAQMNCTVTDENGFISFTYNAKKDLDGGK